MEAMAARGIKRVVVLLDRAQLAYCASLSNFVGTATTNQDAE